MISISGVEPIKASTDSLMIPIPDIAIIKDTQAVSIGSTLYPTAGDIK